MHLEYDERDENRIRRGGVLWQTWKSIWDFWIKHSLGQGKSFVQEQGGFRLQKIQAAATARVFAGSGLVLLNEMAVTLCYNCFLLIESIICIIKSSVNNNWVCFLFRLQWCLHFMQHFWTFRLTLQWCVPNHSSHRAAPERRLALHVKMKNMLKTWILREAPKGQAFKTTHEHKHICYSVASKSVFILKKKK